MVLLCLKDIEEGVDEAWLLLCLRSRSVSDAYREKMGKTHVSQVQFSLSSCVCVWVEGCPYAVPQHTHVHHSYSKSGL